MKNLAHSASFDSDDKDAPSKPGIKQLAPASDEALRQIFRIYRVAAQTTYSVPAPERSADLPSAHPVSDDGSDAGAASKANASERASAKAVGTRVATAKTVSWQGRRREKVVAARVRLVANGDAWPLWATRISPVAEGAGEVIVLSAGHDARAQHEPEASIDLNRPESAAPPACRDPPQVVARRRATAEPAAEQRRDGSTALSPDDIVVSDDIGPQIPICAAELEVIETYLGHLLDDLFDASTEV